MIPQLVNHGQPERSSSRPLALPLSRRTYLQLPIGWMMTQSAVGETVDSRFAPAAAPLAESVASGEMRAASLWVRQGDQEYAWFSGAASSQDAAFLIASITKPLAITAALMLADSGDLDVERPVVHYLPEFTGEGREAVLVWHLLTHVSGLPDQLATNTELRSSHAPLSAFVAAALQAPLAFPPGRAYSYSSMGILLATEIAERISGRPLRELLAQRLFEPLGMTTASLGLGGRDVSELVACQVEYAAPEAGAGAENSRGWDWNSRYWRDFGAPWGGVHASARDVGTFFWEAMHPTDRVMKPATWRLMTTNRNPPGITPRGFGLGVGKASSHLRGSAEAFGHTGATGTLAWADPATDTVCVVLTTLPGTAKKPHPRQRCSDLVGKIAAT